MNEHSVTVGIAIIGMTTAASQMLDAARMMRVDAARAIELLDDAIACAQEAGRAATGNQGQRIAL